MISRMLLAYSGTLVAFCGATFGLVVYGMYDLTNLAVLKGWTVGVAAVDMPWGAAVSGASSAAGHAAARLAGAGI